MNRPRLRRPVGPVLRAAAGAILVASIVAFLVSGYVRTVPEFSITDEFVHFDYVDKVGHGEVVSYNERVGQAAMHAEACRGIQGGFGPPPCRSVASGYDADDFQYRGVNTAGSHTPAYYAITWAAARTLQETPTRGWDLLTASRLAGAGWLLSGLAVFFLACRAAGIGAWSAGAVAIGMSSTQLVLQSSARVNNDAAAMLAGSFMLLCGIQLVRTDRGRRWVAAALVGAVVVVAFKLTHAVALVAFAALMLVGGGGTSSTRRRRVASAILGVSVVVAGFATYVVWDRFQSGAALPPLGFEVVQNPAFYVDSVGFTDVLRQTWAYTRLLEEAWLPMQYNLGIAVYLEGLAVFGLLLLGAAYVGSAPASMVARIAAATALAAIVTPATLMLMTWFTNHVYIPIPGRYGLALLPWFGIVAAAACEQWRAVRIGATFAVTTMVVAWTAQFAILS